MNFSRLYSDFLRRFLNPARPMRVVLDASDGVTGPLLKQIFVGRPRIIAYLLNGAPDGNFPAHGPDPRAPHAIDALSREVRRRHADLGAIFDGDGDRVFFTDETGQPLESDVTGRLLISHLRPRKIVADTCSGWLIIHLSSSGLHATTFVSRVGHYYIKKMMRKVHADLGIEKSGHYYFKEFFGKDSGILAALHAVNAVSRLPYTLKNFSHLLPQSYRSKEINFSVRHAARAMRRIEARFKARASRVSHLDGIRMEFGDAWWFNVRPSNTEPLLRLNLEAQSKKLLDQRTRELLRLIAVSK